MKELMRRALLTFVISMLSAASFCAPQLLHTPFSDESLHYVITYKWGLVHKDAGEAVLSLRNKGNTYNVSLTARTKPWADKFFMVRDTLTAVINKSDFRVREYVKNSHEGGRYAKDVINYSYNGSNVIGKCRKYREKKGVKRNDTNTLTASGPVYDMLSIFYYLRNMDYRSITQGKSVTATVFSGSKAENVTIKPIGLESVKLRNGKIVKGFHLRFNFTTGGKKKSSDDIDVWLSNDTRHVPLLLIGKLSVGQVKCYLTN